MSIESCRVSGTLEFGFPRESSTEVIDFVEVGPYHDV